MGITGTPGSTARPNYVLSLVETNGGFFPSDTPNLVGPSGALQEAKRYSLSAPVASSPLVTVFQDGLYRLNYYMDVTGGTATAGTIALYVSWNDTTSARVHNGTALDATASNQAYVAESILMRCEAGSQIDFETQLYNVVGSPQYGIFITVERLM